MGCFQVFYMLSVPQPRIHRSSRLNLTQILVIIPVLNEESTIATAIRHLQNFGLTQIRVVDNGSTDRSAAIARAAGAQVVSEPIPGYGRACWRGLQNLDRNVKWILFCDGDGSDELDRLDPLHLLESQLHFVA